jgi:hypothetical protein
VNHQHFQCYLRDPGGYPIEDPRWVQNGGAEPYPLDCHRLAAPGEAWREVAECHGRGVAYNLLYRPGAAYLVPRRMQEEVALPSWSSGFAWSEVAGSFTTFNQADYGALGEAGIREEMGRLAL